MTQLEKQQTVKRDFIENLTYERILEVIENDYDHDFKSDSIAILLAEAIDDLIEETSKNTMLIKEVIEMIG